jgi:hypothetical protein
LGKRQLPPLYVLFNQWFIRDPVLGNITVLVIQQFLAGDSSLYRVLKGSKRSMAVHRDI